MMPGSPHNPTAPGPYSAWPPWPGFRKKSHRSAVSLPRHLIFPVASALALMSAACADSHVTNPEAETGSLTDTQVLVSRVIDGDSVELELSGETV